MLLNNSGLKSSKVLSNSILESVLVLWFAEIRITKSNVESSILLSLLQLLHSQGVKLEHDLPFSSSCQ